MRTKLELTFIIITAGCGADDPVDAVDAAVKRPERPDAAATPDAAIAIDATVCTATNDTCTGETICIAGACEAAFGRYYDIRDLAVTVPTLDPNGLYWDFAGGAPDLFVTIATSGVVRAATPTIDDRFSSTFSGPFAVLPVGGGSLLLAAYDADFDAHDFAYACAADPLTAAQLRTRRLQCADGGNAMSFTIEPR